MVTAANASQDREQATCLPTEGQAQKTRYIHTSECHPAVKKNKKNKILLFAAIWIELELVILSKVSRTQKDKYYVTLLIVSE